MRRTAKPNRILAAALLGVAATAFAAQARAAGRPGPSDEAVWKDKNYKYQNASACAQCHILPTGNQFPKPDDPKGTQALNLVLMTEYSIWKTHDKHAQAYAVLEGPRGKKMGRLLGETSGKAVDVTKKEAGCLNCHAMVGLAGSAEEGQLDPKDGVSCGGCHGPSSEWLGPHQVPSWRKKTPTDKTALGLRDLRDPEIRSQLCMSCHIGNAAEGKVVTHAMFAAGHPPLPPIEIATFSHNEPQHWRDAYAVPYFQNPSEEIERNYHLKDINYRQTKLALVGGVVSLRETLRMAAARADFSAANPAQVWPELLPAEGAAPPADDLRKEASVHWPEIAMAHSDCYACHHDLRYPSYRQERGFGYRLPGKPPVRVAPGRVLVRLWPTALLDPAAAYLGKPEKVTALEAGLRGLADACNARQFGSPSEIAKSSAELIAWSDGMVAELKNAPYNRDTVRRLMLNLCKVYEPREGETGAPLLPDYESAKQIASLLTVAYGDLKREGDVPDAAAALEALAKQLNLEPYSNRERRLEIIFEIVQKAAGANLTGKEEFLNYLKNKDVGNVEVIRKLVRDQGFLNALRSISNEDFNKGLVEHDAELQKLSDQEEERTLRAIAEYNPALFKENLSALARALGAGK